MNRLGIASLLTILFVSLSAFCAKEPAEVSSEDREALRKAFLWGNEGLIRGVTDFQQMTLGQSIRVAALFNQNLMKQRRDVLSSIQGLRGARNFFDVRGNLSLEHDQDVHTPTIRTGSVIVYDPVLGQNVETAAEAEINDDDLTTLQMNLVKEVNTGGSVTVTPYLQESDFQRNQWSSGVRVDVRQPLLDGFGSEVSTVDVRTSELSLEQSENNLENSLRQVVVGVVADYYGLLKAGLILEEQQQSLERSREQARAVKIRREEGQVADLDVLQADLKVAQNENQLLSAQNDLNASRINFRLQLGLPSDVAVGIEPIDVAFATREYSFQESANFALEHRLDIQNQQLSREQSRLQLVRARNQKLPNFDLSASYDFRDGDARLKDVGTFEQGQINVVALFQMPLGDVSDDVRLKRAEYTLEQAEISLEQLQQQVVGEVDKEIRRIRTLQNQVLSLRKNVELAEENYRLSRMSFEIGGLISSFDLANAMDDLTVARTSYVSALIDYRIALANLDLVRGVDLIPLIQEQIGRTQVTSAD